MRLAIKSTRQGRQIWRDKGHGLGGEAAERALIAAMAVVLGGRFIVVDVNAEFRCVAKERLKLGRDRRVIGAGESGRGKSWRGRGGEKLNDERERDQKCGQRRAVSRRAQLRPTNLSVSFEPAHVKSPLSSARGRRPTVSHWRTVRNS
jgi:hypothetical protein